jgi:hemolysin III
MAVVVLSPTFDTRLGFSDRLEAHPIYGARPMLRGRFHQAAAVLSIPVGVQVVLSSAGTSRPAAVAYAVTCTLMFATSAAYHRLAQGVTARFWMRRLDHSMILVHIAGGSTPVAVAGVGGAPGRALLMASWGVAGVGVFLKLTGLTSDHDPAAWAFPILGWLPLVTLPLVADRAGWTPALLLAATMTVYTAGAVCFRHKRPDPAPTVFGYHEVWHVFTLVAGAIQLWLTLTLLTPTP